MYDAVPLRSGDHPGRPESRDHRHVRRAPGLLDAQSHFQHGNGHHDGERWRFDRQHRDRYDACQRPVQRPGHHEERTRWRNAGSEHHIRHPGDQRRTERRVGRDRRRPDAAGTDVRVQRRRLYDRVSVCARHDPDRRRPNDHIDLQRAVELSRGEPNREHGERHVDDERSSAGEQHRHDRDRTGVFPLLPGGRPWIRILRDDLRPAESDRCRSQRADALPARWWVTRGDVDHDGTRTTAGSDSSRHDPGIGWDQLFSRDRRRPVAGRESDDDVGRHAVRVTRRTGRGGAADVLVFRRRRHRAALHAVLPVPEPGRWRRAGGDPVPPVGAVGTDLPGPRGAGPFTGHAGGRRELAGTWRRRCRSDRLGQRRSHRGRARDVRRQRLTNLRRRHRRRRGGVARAPMGLRRGHERAVLRSLPPAGEPVGDTSRGDGSLRERRGRPSRTPLCRRARGPPHNLGQPGGRLGGDRIPGLADRVRQRRADCGRADHVVASRPVVRRARESGIDGRGRHPVGYCGGGDRQRHRRRHVSLDSGCDGRLRTGASHRDSGGRIARRKR